MTRLSQILAVSKGAQARASTALTAAYQLLQKPVPLTGISRTYEPKNVGGDEFPPEQTLVQVTADGLLVDVLAKMVDWYDITATRETANCTAKADVVVNGEVLLTAVPVTVLLFLEKQLVDLRTFFSRMPVLDPSESWSLDPATNVWVTEPVLTNRTVKVPFNHVKAAATDKHPAQVEVMYHEEVMGFWTKRGYSGAMPALRVRELTARADLLAAAVKTAREEANTMEVERQTIAADLFRWLTATSVTV